MVLKTIIKENKNELIVVLPKTYLEKKNLRLGDKVYLDIVREEELGKTLSASLS